MNTAVQGTIPNQCLELAPQRPVTDDINRHEMARAQVRRQRREQVQKALVVLQVSDEYHHPPVRGEFERTSRRLRITWRKDAVIDAIVDNDNFFRWHTVLKQLV